jgi:hypothetical protein
MVADDVSKDSIPRLTQTSQYLQGSQVDRSNREQPSSRSKGRLRIVSNHYQSQTCFENPRSRHDSRVQATASCETSTICFFLCSWKDLFWSACTGYRIAPLHSQRSMASSFLFSAMP